MSYDILIAGAPNYSRSTHIEPLREFIAALPGIKPNGSDAFVLGDADRIWMEIYLSDLDGEGDVRDDARAHARVNCVSLHIPYGRLGDDPARDYFPTALAIGRHLGWPVIDQQTGDLLLDLNLASRRYADQATRAWSADRPGRITPPRRWWRFWHTAWQREVE